MQVERYSSGGKWEQSVGFSRAVRAGELIFTAGTLAAGADGVVQGADCYEQCCYIFEKLNKALKALGGTLDTCLSVTAYITAMEHADGFSRAHAQYLRAARPATTCVVVRELFAPAAVVEIALVALTSPS